jgi:hypothetical protein
MTGFRFADFLFHAIHASMMKILILLKAFPKERIMFCRIVMSESLQKTIAVARALPTLRTVRQQSKRYALLHAPSSFEIVDNA